MLPCIAPTCNFLKPFLWGSMILFVLVLVSTACSTPACIQCQNVPGYPNTTICREAYETALTEDTPSWREYADEAISKGCTAAE